MSNGSDPDQDQQYWLVLICVQTVCKGYQQLTKVDTRKERVKTEIKIFKNIIIQMFDMKILLTYGPEREKTYLPGF